jgi:N-acetylmuramoyl-L-alanine amidase
VKPPAVYIELGNIRNGFDQQRIVLGSNRGALANWLLEGLLQQKKASR